MTKAAANKPSKSELTREKILRAAERVFARYGYEGARLDEIARVAKLDQPHIYYYFNGKQSLYKALIDSVITDVALALDHFMQRPPRPLAERSDELVDLIFDLIEQRGTLLAVGLTELTHPPKNAKTAPGFLRTFEKLETLLLAALNHLTGDRRAAAQLLLSLESVLFYPLLVDDDRIAAITGEDKRTNLPERQRFVKQHVRALLRETEKK